MHTLKDIENSPDNFKKCSSCGKINWHTNTLCIECDESGFNYTNDAIAEWVETTSDYYKIQETPYAIYSETLFET